MFGNFRIQPCCLQMLAVPVYIEYAIADHKWLVIPVISPGVYKCWQFLYTLSTIAVYRCLEIPVISSAVYKCRQFPYALRRQLRYTHVWYFLYSAFVYKWHNSCIHWVCNCGIQRFGNSCNQPGLFTNASNSCINWVCNCGIQMSGSSSIQLCCLQTPAIPVCIEYAIAVYNVW